MTQIHAMIRETQQATEDGYQAEKHAQLLGALAGLLAPHLDQLIGSNLESFKQRLNDRDLQLLVRAAVREELEKIEEKIDARVKRAVDDLNDRDLGLVRAVVREELDDQADGLEDKVNEIIDEREFIDQDSLDEKIEEKIDEVLRERELVRKDELDDKIAEALGTFAQGDTMRDKIQDALQEMTGSFTLSRY